jgi:LacI family repressor for deo operon, udp, cdd, tsx, nupC, and nupG
MSAKISTINDVARLSGVSAGTVSKYINNPASVKEKNRSAIAQAIDVLNYTPNALAQKLGSGRSDTILLFILSEDMISESTWLHQLPLIQVFGDYLRNTKYNLQIEIGQVNAPEESCRYIERCINGKNIDAVALLSAWEIPKPIVMMLIKKDFPFVLIDNHNPILRHNEVIFDNAEMVEQLVDLLAENGHKKIGFITVKSNQQHINDRFIGFKNAMRRHAFEIDDNLICDGDFSIGSGYTAMDKLLKNGYIPSAMICGNDNMAVGAINAIKANGFKVPGDISVVGIDNSIVAQAVDPMLTSMELPMANMGRFAIESLLKRIDDKGYEIRTRTFPCKLIRRDSVAAAK